MNTKQRDCRTSNKFGRPVLLKHFTRSVKAVVCGSARPTRETEQQSTGVSYSAGTDANYEEETPAAPNDNAVKNAMGDAEIKSQEPMKRRP